MILSVACLLASSAGTMNFQVLGSRRKTCPWIGARERPTAAETEGPSGISIPRVRSGTERYPNRGPLSIGYDPIDLLTANTLSVVDSKKNCHLILDLI